MSSLYRLETHSLNCGTFDNTWLVFDRGLAIEDLAAQFPRSLTLRRLLRGMSGLAPYLLAAQTLNGGALAAQFNSAPEPFLAAAPDTGSAIADAFVERGVKIETVIDRDRPVEI
jgi:hypothetical protein